MRLLAGRQAGWLAGWKIGGSAGWCAGRHHYISNSSIQRDDVTFLFSHFVFSFHSVELFPPVNIFSEENSFN